MPRLISPLECILTKNAPASSLEFTLTKSLDLKPQVFTFFQEMAGVLPGVPAEGLDRIAWFGCERKGLGLDCG